MRTRSKVWLGIVVFIAVLGLAASLAAWLVIRRPWPKVAGTIQVEGLRAEATIIRDNWGVPHIYSSNPHDLFFAQGYVHAQDRFWQMEFWRRVGLGRLAEVLGESALDSDLFIRTVGWHHTAAQELELIDDELLAVLEAYSAGVNSYISANQGRLGLEFTILGLTGVKLIPEPWTPLNTLTWAKVMAWDLSGNMGTELLRSHIAARLGTPAVAVLSQRYPENSPFVVPNPAISSAARSAPASVPQVLTEATLGSLPNAAFDTHFLGTGDGVGSNNWVVAGSRTDTGMPILADDTHLGIQMPSIWYEVGLHCEPVGDACPYQVVGFSFAGAPGVIIGHNDRIAWGVTNLAPDVQDLFIERVNPENPNQYEFQGEWLDMTIIREEIAVAGREDGEPVVASIRLTHHGPIINDVVGGPEEEWSFGWQPLALSWTGLQPGTLLRSALLLDRAGNWEEFRAALSLWDVPSQNFVYADVEGNIGYQAPGRIPIRAAGNGSMPMPGWTGDHEWIGYIPYDELPRSFNPPEGYIVSANNAVVPPDFPHFISLDWAPGYRARRIADLIEANSLLSVSEMQTIQGDSTPLWAQSMLPALRSLPAPQEPRLAQALAVLRTWDGRAVRDSGGAVLFEAFERHLIDLTFGDELGSQLLEQGRFKLMVALEAFVGDPHSPWFDDVTTLETESRDDMLVQALEEAVEELTETLGKNMGSWRWGDLHTATFRNQSLGGSGIGLVEALFNRGPVPVDGSIGTVNATGYMLSKPYGVSHLSSQRQIVDLSDFQRSVTMHTTGQSGHPFHRHYDDMIDPWRNIEYHPMHWNRSALEADAEGIMVLRPLTNAR